jgi:hypothetical protein
VCSRIRVGPQAAAFRSPVPPLAPLPLHGDAGGIADFDPDPARAGPIGTVNPLGNDTFGPKLTSVREHGRPILGDVFVKQDAGLGIAESSRQRSLAFEKRESAQILAIMLDKVERVEDRGSSSFTTGQLLEP